jgi:Pentapeptide repeats (8 copies)
MQDTNSGPHNSGPHNSGPHNSGPHNSGPHNSGPHNSGPHNSGPRYLSDGRKRYKVDVGPHIDRLKKIADARGYAVGDLVRFCVERVLPEFEKS